MMNSRLFLYGTGAALLALSLAACGLPLDGAAASTSSRALVSVRPSLGVAAGFAVLGASTVTCTNASAVTGDVGVSPGTAITGFNPDCTITGTIHAGDAVAAQAHHDLVTAYNGLAALACEHNLTGQDLGGQTLAPGVYCFNSSVGITGQLTLDAGGDANAIWVFQIGSTITTASNASVVMAGGGQPCNAFWQVGSSATLGTGTAFQGNVLAYASITLTSGTSLTGRALALNAAVTMDHNTVSAGCSQSGPPTCAGRNSGSGRTRHHTGPGVCGGRDGGSREDDGDDGDDDDHGGDEDGRGGHDRGGDDGHRANEH